MLMPLWPAYGEALAREERSWVTRTLKRSLAVTIALSAGIAAVVTIFSQRLFRIWIGHPLDVPTSLLLGFAVLAVVSTCGNGLATLLNAASVIRFQLATAVVMGVAAVIGKIVLGRHFGLPGVVWGTVIASCVFSLIPTLIYVRRWLSAGTSVPEAGR
jgi:O-antigen/teichoic acid export membrane protein